VRWGVLELNSGLEGVLKRDSALNLKLNPVGGTLETEMPARKQVAFSFPVPGTGTDEVANKLVWRNW